MKQYYKHVNETPDPEGFSERIPGGFTGMIDGMVHGEIIQNVWKGLYE